jgi:hypothetical protein
MGILRGEKPDLGDLTPAPLEGEMDEKSRKKPTNSHIIVIEAHF